MGWKPEHKRIKPKRVNATNQEMAHRRRIKQLPCYGCGVSGINEAHHTLLPFPGKYARRDHRFLLPLCNECHRGRYGVHGIGNEATWLERQGKTPDDAIAFAQRLWEESNA